LQHARASMLSSSVRVSDDFGTNRKRQWQWGANSTSCFIRNNLAPAFSLVSLNCNLLRIVRRLGGPSCAKVPLNQFRKGTSISTCSTCLFGRKYSLRLSHAFILVCSRHDEDVSSQDEQAGRLASLNPTWQSNKGTFRA
jgi:hypothetical protein